MPDVDVEFKIYNYAEFYTAARRHTNAQGITDFEAGQGNALFYASKNGYYGFNLVFFGNEKQVITLQLNHKVGDEVSAKFHIVPPVGSDYLPPITLEQKALNECRFKQEDSIRMVYTNTFLTRQRANELALQKGYDSTTIAPLLVKARGNYDEIAKFLSLAASQHKEKKRYSTLAIAS